ncbi:hypothetical protein K2173_006540 [Erythroxylum novogranatense]|uniref:Rho termination factor-like N-terminal domain-containing protein n=1 Tax=Erythroxylum novogranatense TaxID=1862640 RepID=A0AAV8T5S9_9ROSI|nr:hypothetical protein K2173_006540 [Erythroxylum novogranatense]
MDVVFYPHSVLSWPSCSSFTNQLKIGKPIVSFKDGPSLFSSWNDTLQSRYSSTHTDGNRKDRPPQKSTRLGRRRMDYDNNKSQPFDSKLPKSSGQEEILALFRRIQSSISKVESVDTGMRTGKASEDTSPTDSVLEFLRQSRKQVKGTATKRGGTKTFRRNQGVDKNKKMGNDEQLLETNIKLTRPPSNFVKRSPIPSPSAPRGQAAELSDEPSTIMVGSPELKLPRMEEMKLSQLKELAKSRGIKGYSKLKKDELMELLKS